MMQTRSLPRSRRAAGWLGLVVVFVILLSACQPAPATPKPPVPPGEPPAPTAAEPIAVEPTDEAVPADQAASQLVGVQWLLVAYGDSANPTVVEEGSIVTALFSEDGNLSGSGGCNNFSTTYELNGDELKVGQIASTMMFCDKGMDQESAVFAALQSAYRIAFSPEGRLEIFYNSASSVELKLIYAPGETPLEDTVWVLQSMGDPANPTSIESGTIITAIFSSEGTLSGSSGCNTYVAGYSAKDGLLKVEQPLSTMMMCTQGMEQETAYLAALTAAESYQISGAKLEIQYNGGKGVLTYTSRNLTLENTLWTLVMVNGERNTTGLVPTTALFDPGSQPGQGAVGGVAMCNNYRGGYMVDGDVLTISEIATTMISCPETVMQAETTYLELLGSAQTYQVMGQTLIITSEKGALTFVANRAPLEGTNWRLNSLGEADNPQPPVAGADFTAVFVRQTGAPSGVMLGTTGCNDYNAAYAANLNEIKINLPNRTNNTGCPAGLPEQEAAFFLALNAATNYRILGDNLQITYGDGLALNFTAFVPAPTPEPSGGPLTSLNGTRWWLVALGQTTVIPGTRVTADFSINSNGTTGMITGLAGCNTYNAAIQGVFQVGPAATTKKICPEPPGVMQQEATYLSMLATSNSFSQAYNQLLIGTGAGLLVYYNSPAPLVPVQPTPTPPAELPATPTPEATSEVPTVEPTEEPATPEPTTEPSQEPTSEPENTPAPPVAVVAGPAEGMKDVAITFDGSASTGEAQIVSYQWDFGDGNQAEGVSVEHTYTAAGSYFVTLTVKDANGLTGTVTVTITIT
jgi:heat shock protein HslJ